MGKIVQNFSTGHIYIHFTLFYVRWQTLTISAYRDNICFHYEQEETMLYIKEESYFRLFLCGLGTYFAVTVGGACLGLLISKIFGLTLPF